MYNIWRASFSLGDIIGRIQNLITINNKQRIELMGGSSNSWFSTKHVAAVARLALAEAEFGVSHPCLVSRKLRCTHSCCTFR